MPKAKAKPKRRKLTHVDARGNAVMVDISEKPATVRVAVAKGSVFMSSGTLALIKKGKVKKGDVFAVARLAGIMAAKRAPEIIPLCHPVALTSVKVDLSTDARARAVHITAACKLVGQTGVEMEALAAVSAAALTVYDMCKAADKTMRIGDIRLVEKSGGRSGDFRQD